MPAPRPKCACCGKPYGQRNTTEQVFFITPGDPIPPQSDTNLIVTRKRVTPHGTDRQRVHYELWDGESWLVPYRPFCTLRCGLEYARRAYRQKHGRTSC